MSDVFIGRQPIFDRQLRVMGYELLYRSGENNQATFLDGNHATSVVISNTFLEMGLEKLVGEKLAFLNLTRPFLMGEYPLPRHPDRLMLEVLEDIALDQELISALRGLVAQGYQLALDDVTDPDRILPVLDLVKLIKVDYMLVDRKRLPEHVAFYKSHGIQLLAEKIETQAELEECQRLGFDYFQGYFLCKPAIVRAKKLTGSKMVILQLLAEMHSTELEFSRIDAVIRQDVALSYKLLRLINSAYYATASRIQTVRQALTLLGLGQVYGWVQLLLLSETDTKPPELMKTAMIRAKMCELLANTSAHPKPEAAFTVGLFSVLDALLDQPLSEILSQVPLSQEITSALLEGHGPMGLLLNCVLAYEKGHWEEASCHQVSQIEVRDAYLEAVRWADEMSGVLASV